MAVPSHRSHSEIPGMLNLRERYNSCVCYKYNDRKGQYDAVLSEITAFCCLQESHKAYEKNNGPEDIGNGKSRVTRIGKLKDAFLDYGLPNLSQNRWCKFHRYVDITRITFPHPNIRACCPVGTARNTAYWSRLSPQARHQLDLVRSASRKF